jgi:Flp pilus assembly protein TadG
MPTPITARRQRRPIDHQGQALTEFALVLPILVLVIGGIIQFGIILWGQNTLNQIARDTGRWEATQQSCANSGAVVTKANEIAVRSSLIGYAANAWTGSNVNVSWQAADGVTTPAPSPCPPTTNTDARWVTIAITHQVPVFFPFIPGNGNLSTTTQFRMEPVSPQ